MNRVLVLNIEKNMSGQKKINHVYNYKLFKETLTNDYYFVNTKSVKDLQRLNRLLLDDHGEKTKLLLFNAFNTPINLTPKVSFK